MKQILYAVDGGKFDLIYLYREKSHESADADTKYHSEGKSITNVSDYLISMRIVRTTWIDESGE